MIAFYPLWVAQIDDCDQPHTRAVAEWDDGAVLDSYNFEDDSIGREHLSAQDLTPSRKRELAYRYRALEKMYSEVRILCRFCAANIGIRNKKYEIHCYFDTSPFSSVQIFRSFFIFFIF